MDGRQFPLNIRRVKVILNSGSGSRSKDEISKLEEKIAIAFSDQGVAAIPTFVDGSSLHENLEKSLQAVEREEFEAIVVGGGDGTLRTAASVLAGSKVPLGILPLGTLNHFAKDLKIPLLLGEAAAVIAAGHVQSVDLGELNGVPFINNSSIGIYPYMVLDRERRQREGSLPKWLAMLLAGFKVFKNLPLRRLSIQCQGFTDDFRSPCVFVGNNSYQTADGSTNGRTSLREGQLYIYIAKKDTRLALLSLALRIVTGRLNQSRDLRIICAAKVTIHSQRKRLLIACDGEVEIMPTPLVYKINPRALRVFTPALGV